jgi:mannose-6-phosphate isomerase-like protein (cupin superfamily)
MIIRSEEMPVEQRIGERNGTITHLLSTGQMHGKNRLFARILLRPGSRVPYHQHDGDYEAYYILSGHGQVNDNGTITEIKSGDIIFTDNKESHSIENTGNTNLEYIALISLL